MAWLSFSSTGTTFTCKNIIKSFIFVVLLFILQDPLITAMILLSSGDRLLCFAEIKYLQRILTGNYYSCHFIYFSGMSQMLLLKWLLYIHVWDSFYQKKKKKKKRSTHIWDMLSSTYWSSQQSSICMQSSLIYHNDMFSLKI